MDEWVVRIQFKHGPIPQLARFGAGEVRADPRVAHEHEGERVVALGQRRLEVVDAAHHRRTLSLVERNPPLANPRFAWVRAQFGTLNLE